MEQPGVPGAWVGTGKVKEFGGGLGTTGGCQSGHRLGPDDWAPVVVVGEGGVRGNGTSLLQSWSSWPGALSRQTPPLAAGGQLPAAPGRTPTAFIATFQLGRDAALQ